MTNRRTTGAALAAAAGLVLSSLALVGAPAQALPGDATISATPNTGLGENTLISISGNAGPLSIDRNGAGPGADPDTTYPFLYISMCKLPLTASSCDTDIANGITSSTDTNPATAPHVVRVLPDAEGDWGPINFLARRTLVNGDGSFDCSDAANQCVIGSANAPRPVDHSYDATQDLEFSVVSSVPTLTSGPTVTGTAAVGKQLTCAATYANATGQTFRWLRGGATIAGASASTYTATATDYNKGVACASTASNGVGSSGETVSLARTIAVGAALKNTTKPKATGTFRVGKKLTATKGKWSPSATTYKYQWLRGGKAIAKATKVTYKLKAADKGKKVSVRVTASKIAYAPGKAVSTATKVKKKLS